MTLSELEKEKTRLLREIRNLGDMRNGSLSVRCQRCSKSPCVCDDPKHPGHGPIYSLSTAVNGKTGDNGGVFEFVDYREKKVLTVLGDVKVRRAYYYDMEGKTGISPKDKTFDIEGVSLSPGLLLFQQQMGRFLGEGCSLNFTNKFVAHPLDRMVYCSAQRRERISKAYAP